MVVDFGHVMSAMPRIAYKNGLAGRQVVVQTSFRLNNTTLSAAVAAGATNIKVASVANFVAGDKITIDQAANGFGKGDPEIRTITAVGTTGANGTGITLDAPLSRAHATARFVEGSRAGTTQHDTQGSNLGWWYTQKDGAQTAQAVTYWGWRYLQVLPPGAGETLTADDIDAVVQYSAAPASRRATFDSDNETLDAVFDLMQRSGIYSSEEVFLDTPTREKGQFTGDTVDISFANMIAAGDRNASARAIREILDSATHSWKAASGGYCTAAQLPCSYPSIGTPGRVNAVYPNGDNMRDIPDYTLMMPDWVWRYYEQSGDTALLAASYERLKLIANYVKTNIATTGPAAGLVYNLFGGTSSYQYGIIDWPAPMRYGYTFNDNAARTIHNAHAVGTLRSTAKAARTLGKPEDAAMFDAWADDLAATINAKLMRPRRPLHRRPLLGRRQPADHQHRAARADLPDLLRRGPAASRAVLADNIVAQGMRQGPMTWHVLLKAIDRPRALRPGREADDRRERRRPGAHARPAGHVHVGAVEPRLQQRLAVQPDQQREHVPRLGRVGHRGHDRVAARRAGHEPGRGDREDRPAGGRPGRPAPGQRLRVDAARDGEGGLEEGARHVRARRRGPGQRQGDGRDPEPGRR